MDTRFIGRGVALAFTILLLAGASGEAAAAPAPIGPQQHFAGLVNGKQGSVTVQVVCPGPAGKHRTGPVRSGQTMAVAAEADGHGDTGVFSQVYAWFQPVPSGAKPVMLSFSQYGVRQRIPHSVLVPCGGTGQAVFSSCPYLAPCAVGFIPDALKVTFQNIAASHSRSRP